MSPVALSQTKSRCHDCTAPLVWWSRLSGFLIPAVRRPSLDSRSGCLDNLSSVHVDDPCNRRLCEYVLLWNGDYNCHYWLTYTTLQVSVRGWIEANQTRDGAWERRAYRRSDTAWHSLACSFNVCRRFLFVTLSEFHSQYERYTSCSISNQVCISIIWM